MIRNGQPWFIDGHPVMRAEVVSFWSVVFNPSTVNRLIHTLIGAFIMGAFFILSISAYYIAAPKARRLCQAILHRRADAGDDRQLRQLISGDSNARMVAHNQPDKLAAFEGLFKTAPARLSLFGIPG